MSIMKFSEWQQLQMSIPTLCVECREGQCVAAAPMESRPLLTLI